MEVTILPLSMHSQIDFDFLAILFNYTPSNWLLPLVFSYCSRGGNDDVSLSKSFLFHFCFSIRSGYFTLRVKGFLRIFIYLFIYMPYNNTRLVV